MKIYVSLHPRSIGGGSNTFAGLFKKWAKKRGDKIVRNIEQAELAIIVAHLADENELIRGKRKGCRIIHRLDEFFEQNESDARRKKHSKIISLNRHADITVFQSRFVCENVYPHIQPQHYRIIHNGSDPEKFYPGKESGNYIGHVTWGIDTKKRLDLLYEFVRKHPREQFILIGRQKESQYDFDLPNVRAVGKVRRWKLPKYFRMMKFLYYPSEKDPCPNSVVEAILSGVPVCYNDDGGTSELVKGETEQELQEPQTIINGEIEASQVSPEDKICGLPLDGAEAMMKDLEYFRNNCLNRADLHFYKVYEKYHKAGLAELGNSLK